MLKDFVLALSLSNLCFIAAWRSLLFPSSFFYYYHQKTPPPFIEYLALVFDVLLLATIFFAGIVFARRSKNEWIKKSGKLLFVLILIVPIYGILMELERPAVRQVMLHFVSDAVAKRLLSTILLTGCIALLAVMMLRLQRTTKIAVTLILILSPLVPLTFSQAIISATKYRDAGTEPSPAPVLAQSGPKPRVLWLIFDELDFRMAFLKRGDTVELPELDRLASESLVGVNAYPPAGETFLTLPALITGRLVSHAERRGPDELLVKFGEDIEAVSWRSQPSVFSRAREAGFNTALFGWYHPYCRVLGSHLSRCSWEGRVEFWETENTGVPPSSLSSISLRMYRSALSAARAIPFWNEIFKSRVETNWVRQRQLSIYNTINRQTLEAATDTDMGLVMVHWPIPHPPNIYDRVNNRISVERGQSYLDNLELVDRTLGGIRQALEAKGLWDSTTVLVTSDHWWRTTYWKDHSTWTAVDEATLEDTLDRRVPFILKMAGTKEPGISYESPFNTVLTHDLLLSVLRGEVTDTKSAAAWLERNRSIGRSPYDEHTAR